MGEQAKQQRPSRENHPVWEVYDLLRRARLSDAYYTAKLQEARRKNTLWEVSIAAFVPSSAVAGLPVWATNYGGLAWGGLVLIASLLAIAKPIINTAATIQSYEASVSRYRTIAADLDDLRRDIRREKRYTQGMKYAFKYIALAMTRAQEIEPVEPLDEELRNRLYARINKELPARDFYVPGDEE